MTEKEQRPYGADDELKPPVGDDARGELLDDWRFEQDLLVQDEGWRLWHMILLVAAIAVLCWLYVAMGAIVILAGIILLIALAVGGAVMFARRRNTQQDSLLWILAIAAERNMPLAPTAAAFASQYRGKYRRRILNLAAQLDSGSTVPEAFERVPRVVSRDAVLLAHVGQQTGRLPQALRMAAHSRAQQLPIWTAIAGRFAYLLGLLLAMQFICGFLLYFIVPKFEAIFRDFGVPLPPVTIGLIVGSHWIINFGWLTAWIPPLEILLLVFLPFSFVGWVNYDVPFFDHLLKRRHAALILRSLSMFVEAGKPIEEGLSTLASHYPTWWVRRKLIRADSEVRHGGAWIDRILFHGLIRPADAEVLSSATEVGNLAWAMRELAETGERRLAYRFQAVVQTLFPLVVIALGAVVCFLAFAFFAPLVVLLWRLAG